MLFNWKGCSLSLFVLSAKDVGFNTLNVTFQVFFPSFLPFWITLSKRESPHFFVRNVSRRTDFIFALKLT